MKRLFGITLPVLLLAVSIGTPVVQAKGSGRISGKVSSKAGDGLLGAIITVFKQDKEGGTISFTRSDRRGIYTLANLTPGMYLLQVSREGYEPITSSQIRILSGKTTTLNVILQEFMDLVSGEPDPRNWDLKSVMRSTSDRRMIFRDLPLPASTEEAFSRGGTINLISATGASDTYSISPTSAQTGIVSNFAFTEPVSEHARMIFSGQLNSGYDSYWQVRNTYNYRPNTDRDIRFSVGYGRLTLNGPSVTSVARPAQFFAQDPEWRESGVETLGFGFEARNRFYDLVSLEYGFDVSRINYGPTKTYVSPYFQLVLTPDDSWTVKTSVASRRVSDNNSILLPDGDLLNLIEPTYIAKINDDIHLSEFEHSEVSLGRKVARNTSLEAAVYRDRMNGPGLPFLMSFGGGNADARLMQLRQDQAAQRGLRMALNHKFFQYVTGSIAYVYGSGATLSNVDQGISSEMMARRLLDYVHRSYYQAFTTRLNLVLPVTGTDVTTVVRWHPGHVLSPIDLFGDRSDTLGKGTNLVIRQPIPLPEFMGSTRRWEALVDVRNLFDQKLQSIQTSDGEILLTRTPRSFRFGLNLNLF